MSYFTHQSLDEKYPFLYADDPVVKGTGCQVQYVEFIASLKAAPKTPVKAVVKSFLDKFPEVDAALGLIHSVARARLVDRVCHSNPSQEQYESKYQAPTPPRVATVQLPPTDPVPKPEGKKECVGAKQVVEEVKQMVSNNRVSWGQRCCIIWFWLLFATGFSVYSAFWDVAPVVEWRELPPPSFEYIEEQRTTVKELEFVLQKLPVQIDYICDLEVRVPGLCDAAKETIKKYELVKREELAFATGNITTMCCGVNRCPLPGSLVERIESPDPSSSCSIQENRCTNYCRVKRLFLNQFGWEELRPHFLEFLAESGLSLVSFTSLVLLFRLKLKSFFLETLYALLISASSKAVVLYITYFGFPNNAFVQAAGQNTTQDLVKWIADTIMTQIVKQM